MSAIVQPQPTQLKPTTGAFAFPDLETLEEEVIPLSSQYWEPRKDGALKELKGVVLGFKVTNYEKVDKDGVVDILPLKCAEIAVQLKHKSGDIYYEIMTNGAVLLVSALENAVASGRILLAETPVKIEYDGVKKTASGNSMDKFRITILAVKH
jgi:hypothetical protein